MKFKQFWTRISNLHINDKMDRLEILHAKIMNQYILLLAINFTVDALRDYFLGHMLSFIFLTSIALILFCFLFFIKNKFNNILIFIGCLCILGIFFYYSSMIGFKSGIALHYFSMMLSILIIYTGNNNIKYAIILYGIIFILFIIGHLHNFHLFDNKGWANAIHLRQIRLVSFIQVFINITFSGYFILLKNNKLIQFYQQTKRSEIIIKELNIRLYNSFQNNVESVVQLAMENDAAFIAKFKLVFPNFYDHLAAINNNITPEEYRFCALLKLGFTTKDIAEYNHLAIRTVQTRKSRLRKSFQIPTELDLYAWVHDL